MSESPLNADAKSPMAGCAILIVAVLVMLFLVGFSTLTLFRQFNEISKFTDEQAKELEVSALDGREAMLNDMSERLEAFRQKLQREEEARLELTPEEVNLAIAAYDSFKDLRKTFRVASVDDDGVRIDISFPLNGKPRLAREGESGLITSDNRYLNGTLIGEPRLLKQEVVLQINRIEVPGAVVPEEFVGQMSPYRLMERYLRDPVLGPAMAKLTRVGVEEGKLVFARVADEIPADLITDAQVDDASTRFMTVLGIAASLFLVFAGVMLFIGLRKKSS